MNRLKEIINKTLEVHPYYSQTLRRIRITNPRLGKALSHSFLFQTRVLKYFHSNSHQTIGINPKY